MASVPDSGVHPIYTTVTPILYPNRSGHATGFFYVDLGDSDSDEVEQTGEQIYLITNHHVVANEDDNPICDSIRIIIRPDSQDLADLQYHDIDLRDNSGNTCWLEHPEGSGIDVVAIH